MSLHTWFTWRKAREARVRHECVRCGLAYETVREYTLSELDDLIGTLSDYNDCDVVVVKAVLES